MLLPFLCSLSETCYYLQNLFPATRCCASRNFSSFSLFQVVLVFSVSAILAANAGVLNREQRTLGLVKYGAAQVAAHPVKAAAAVLGARKNKSNRILFLH